jgi:hypothetical protein
MEVSPDPRGFGFGRHPGKLEEGVQNVFASRHVSWQTKKFGLVLIVCSWLSYTLGFNLPMEQYHNHFQFAVETELLDHSIENTIQWQSVQLGIIASEISAIVRRPDQMRGKQLRYLAGKLQVWQSNVPAALSLSTVLTGQTSELGMFAAGSISLVQLVYLGAIILLYHQLLIAPESSIQALNISQDELRGFRADCQLAAEQVSRLLCTHQYGGRCWFTV